MNETVQQIIKKFVFSTKNNDFQDEKLEILVPELAQASYSFYTWPSASVLAWFIWENKNEFKNKQILEIGAGTALPGILAAKIGANVILSDSKTLPKSLEHLKRCVQINNLDKEVKIIGITWGLFLNDLLEIANEETQFEYIIASDCFYDPVVFEDILCLIRFLFDLSPNCKFLFTYQERSSDWSIENLLKKWKLQAKQLDISQLGAQANLTLMDITGSHTINLYEMKTL